MTPGHDIPTGDDEQLDALRDAWNDALDTPLPLDADDEPRDERTAAAVHWARNAWNVQQAETVVPPDVRALAARRRKTETTDEAITSRPWRRIAAAIVVIVGIAAWQLDRDLPVQSDTPVALDTAPPTTDSASSAPEVAQIVDDETHSDEVDLDPSAEPNDVRITRADDHSIEFVSGPVRLIMVTP